MNIVISQPRYLPALNYLQRLHGSDCFVILDIVQRQSRGWENRNKLLLPDPQWMTIPIASSSRSKLVDTKILDMNWVEEHKSRIVRSYSGAPFFDQSILDALYEIPNYLAFKDISFVELIVCFLKNAATLLKFNTNIILASEIISPEDACTGPSLLRELCEKISGTRGYISGPNGLSYGVCDAFKDSSVEVFFHKYNHPVYDQNRMDFVPYMGFLDAIFNCGLLWVSTQVKQPLELEKNCAESC